MNNVQIRKRRVIPDALAEAKMQQVIERFNRPDYIVVKDRCVIRVYHGDLCLSWWKRGDSHGERLVGKVESAIRAATGLKKIRRRHIREVVEFKIRKNLFDRAAVAVSMEFKPLEETDLIRGLLERIEK